MRSPRILLLLITLAVAVYVPVMSFPFIASSFIEIPVSRVLGSWGALPTLIQNANWHFRITYALVNSWLVQWFGFEPRPFYIAGIAIHSLCVGLIYSMGRWRLLSYTAAAWAAGFFAVYEGHHAAVMSLSSWPDLLATLFACAALLVWIRWMQANETVSYILALLFFAGALISNESGFPVAALLGLALFAAGKPSRRQILFLAPFAALAIAAVAIQLTMRTRELAWETSLPGLDPWWITTLWAVAGVACLTLLRARDAIRLAAACAIWIAITWAAGAYLAFVLHVGSHVSYLSSVGLALLIGLAFSKLQHKAPLRIVIALATLVLVLNVGLLWTKRRKQMFDLAAPTQTLINAAGYAQGPIRLSCFPYALEVAQAAAQSVGVRVVTDKKGDVRTPHCVSFSYKDALGSVRQVYMRSAL
jgi:xanthosine utilization system XapX-like protein